MIERERQDYRRLVSRFGAARRAWKRAAVLSGIVVVVIEALGAFTLAVLVDILFAPSPAGRTVIFAAALATAVLFALRHIVKPLLRSISNEQLALYFEHRNPQFEGALIAAAEFGPDASFQGRQAEIVDSILREAVARAEKFDLRKAIDLSRFRKYALIATALVGAYVGVGLLLPDSLGPRLGRIIAPWKLTPEEEAAQNLAALRALPITFTLSRGDGEMLRGSAFELEAVLSRHPPEGVVFHFRSLVHGAGAAWKVLPMKELEKLNAFGALLADVNEEFEFFVSSGAYKSDPHRVDVYDPLTVKGLEIATHFPDYMKLPDRVEAAETADVTAPVGSTVTIRLSTNRPLRGGDVLWEKGEPTIGRIDPAQKMVAMVSFPVSDTATFRYRLSDVSGQVLESPAPATVTAVVDQPPSVKLLKPDPSVSGNPLAEIPFSAEVADDFGLAGGDLVVARTIDGKVQEQRLPLAFDADTAREAVTSAKASIVLALETIRPAVMPGDVLTCYLEVRDRKSQAAASDMVVVTITSFEAWAYCEQPHGEHTHMLYFLEPVIKATWELHRTKSQLAPKEFDTQAEDIAATMVDPKTKELHPYFDPEHIYGEKLEHGKQAMKYAGMAHDALVKHDEAAALSLLQIALAELKASGYTELVRMMQPPPGANAASLQQELRVMTALMTESAAANAKDSKETHNEKSSAADAAQAEAVKQAQAEVVEQIKQTMAQPPAQAQKQAETTANKESKLAEQAQDIAKSVKENAAGSKEKTAAAAELTGAAQSLHEAAAAAKANNLPKALAKAESAHQQLTAASEKLNANSQDRINQLLADGASLSQELHRKQAEVLKQTQAAPQANAAKLLGQQQIKLTGNLQKLQEVVTGLQKVEAAGGLKPETAKHVDEAAQAIKRSRIEQKMTNAAVELAAANAQAAVPHQTKAVEALAKVQEELVAANAARGTDLVTALAQAKAQARSLLEKLEQMGAPTQPKGAKKPAAKTPRNDLAQKTADDAQRLAQQLAARDFARGDEAFGKDIEQIQSTAKDRDKLAAELVKPPAPDKFARVTQRVADKLEAAYQAALDAKRLFAAQREECPPQYRRLVNQYFEALSKQEK
jgi:hypothetical protein